MWFAAVFSLGVVLISYVRIYFGIDFTDEGLYSAIPYRFFLGDRPYRDELNLTQSASLVVYPIYAGFFRWAGSAEGVFLFARHLCFFMSLGVAAVFFHSFREKADLSWLLVAATLHVVFIPYNLFGPSYNFLGSSLFALGLYLGWDASKRTVLRNVVVGSAHGLAAFVYPSLVVAAAVYFCFLMVTSRQRLREGAAYALSGTAIVFALLGFHRVAVSDLRAVAEYVSAAAAATRHKWSGESALDLVYQLWNGVSYKPLLGGLLLVTALSSRRAPRIALATTLLLSVALFFANRAVIGGNGFMGFLRYQALLAPFFYVLSDRDSETHPPAMIWGIWLPSLTAGLAMAWSSNMGIQAAAVGLVPASLVSLYFAGLFLSAKQPLIGRVPRSARFALPTLLCVAIGAYSLRTVYMDDSLGELTEPVKQGPYKGLYTTPRKHEFLMQLSRDLETARNVGGKAILFQPHFPAGYLLTQLKPAALSVWATCPDALARRCYAYYQLRSQSGALVVHLKETPNHKWRTGRSRLPERSPLLEMLEKSHYAVVKRTQYGIYATLPNAMSVSPQLER